MSLGVSLKWLKSVLMKLKVTLLLIETYFLVYLRPERSLTARPCACLPVFYLCFTSVLTVFYHFLPVDLPLLIKRASLTVQTGTLLIN